MDIKNKRTVIFPDDSIEMINKLKMKVGHLSDSEVLRSALYSYYTKIFKDYIDIKNVKGASPEEVAQRKVMIEDQKEVLRLKKEEERVMLIVESLDGTVSTRSDGEKVCKWVVHHLKADYPQEMKLSQLTTDLPKYQFVPNKKAVEAYKLKNKI